MIAVPLAKKIAELFLILFAAAALVKTGVLKSENSKVLSKLSLYFTGGSHIRRLCRRSCS